MSNGDQFKAIAGLIAKNKPSVDFCGYWQWAKVAIIRYDRVGALYLNETA